MMEIAIKKIWIKAIVFITAFAICVSAYVLPDKSQFDLLKLLWQSVLIALVYTEYGVNKLAHCFIAFTVCAWIYLAPYKAQTDLICLIIEVALLSVLYMKWKAYFMLRLLNLLVLISALYGLIKELSGWATYHTITDWIIGVVTIGITLYILSSMAIKNAKQ